MMIRALVFVMATHGLIAHGDRVEKHREGMAVASDIKELELSSKGAFVKKHSEASSRDESDEIRERMMRHKQMLEDRRTMKQQYNTTPPTFTAIEPSYDMAPFKKSQIDPRLEAWLKGISIQTDGIADYKKNGYSCDGQDVHHKHFTIYFPFEGSNPSTWKYPNDVAMHNLAAYLPAAIAMVRCKKDLADVIGALNEFPGTPYCVKSGGHDYRAASACRGVMIDISRMNYHDVVPGVTPPVIRAATGANLGMLTWFLRKINRIFPHGDSVAVGLGGHALHGGWDGLTTRKFGFLTHHIKGGKAILWNGEEKTFDKDTNSDLLFLARGGGFEEVGVVYEIDIYTHDRPQHVCCVGRGAPGVPAANWPAAGFRYAASTMPNDLHIGMKITHTGAGFGLCHLNKECKDWTPAQIQQLNTDIFATATDWHFSAESKNPTVSRPSGALPAKPNDEWTQEEFVDDVFAKRLEPYNMEELDTHWKMKNMLSYEYEHNPNVFSQFDRYVEMAQGFLTQRSFYVPATALQANAAQCANLFQKVDAVVKKANLGHSCVDPDGAGSAKSTCVNIEQYKFHSFTTIAAGGGALKDWSTLMAARDANSVKVPKDTVKAAIREPGEVWIFRYECHWYVPDAAYKTFCWQLTKEYEQAVGPCASEGIYFADRWQNSWGESAFFGSNTENVGNKKHAIWAAKYGNAFYGELPNMWR